MLGVLAWPHTRVRRLRGHARQGVRPSRSQPERFCAVSDRAVDPLGTIASTSVIEQTPSSSTRDLQESALAVDFVAHQAPRNLCASERIRHVQQPHAYLFPTHSPLSTLGLFLPESAIPGTEAASGGTVDLLAYAIPPFGRTIPA